MRAVALLVVAGCGRIGFSPVPGDGSLVSGDGGPVVDAPPLGLGVAYLRASNAEAGDQFGLALAVSRDGSTIAVGAPTESGGDNVINGNQASNTSPDAGAVYVFVRTGTQWTQQAYVKPTNTDGGDQFGWAVALSADGNTLAVGARHEDGNGVSQANNTTSNSGAAYVFTRAGTSWSQQAYLKALAPNDSDEFGSSLALSDDGSTLIVGAPLADTPLVDAGVAFVFSRTGTTWSVPGELIASNADANDWFGWQVALTAGGTTAVVSATRESSASASTPADNSLSQAGALYTFTQPAWQEGPLLKASNPMEAANFGYSVAVSSDASTIAAGAIDERSNARGFDGNQADRSAPSAGAGYVLAGDQHALRAYAKAPNADPGDSFGWSIALSADGNVMIVGAANEAGGAITDGDEASNALPDAGAAYVATRNGDTWRWAHYLKATTPGAGDLFGWAVGMAGDASVLAVSAPADDGPGETTTDAGAVYVLY